MSDKRSGLFSVVVLHFNQGHYWKAAVDSILEQDYPSIEIIFSDDGSTRFNSRDVEDYIAARQRGNVAAVKIVANKDNIGTVAAYNKADGYCEGDYVLHFAADDVLAAPTVLSTLAARLDAESDDVCGVFGRAAQCDSSLEPISDVDYAYKADYLKSLDGLTAEEQFVKAVTRGRNIFHIGATAFRASTYRKTIPIPEENRLIEDWPYIIGATYSGYRFVHEASDVLLYRKGGITTIAKIEFSSFDKQVRADHARIYEAYILQKDLKSFLSASELVEVIHEYEQARPTANQWVTYGQSELVSNIPLKLAEFRTIIDLICWLAEQDVGYSMVEASKLAIDMVEGMDADDQPVAFSEVLDAFCASDLIAGIIEHDKTCGMVRKFDWRYRVVLGGQLASTQGYLDEVLGSTTWKLGRAIMFLPGTIKKLVLEKRA